MRNIFIFSQEVVFFLGAVLISFSYFNIQIYYYIELRFGFFIQGKVAK